MIELISINSLIDDYEQLIVGLVSLNILIGKVLEEVHFVFIFQPAGAAESRCKLIVSALNLCKFANPLAETVGAEEDLEEIFCSSPLSIDFKTVQPAPQVIVIEDIPEGRVLDPVPALLLLNSVPL